MLLIKAAPEEFTGPRVSKAIGTNSYVKASDEYLAFFLLAEYSAAAPAADIERGRLVGARVSVTYIYIHSIYIYI